MNCLLSVKRRSVMVIKGMRTVEFLEVSNG